MTLSNPSNIVILLLLALQPCVAWNPTSPNSRRSFVATLTGSALVIATRPEQALAQPSEFSNIGTQAPIVQEGETSFITLDNGVKIKEFNQGSGETVGPGARVSVQCSGRLLNLNGVGFYNTKNNNPDGFGAVPLTFTLGKGQALPGLEAGILGMRKNGIRRIIIPADLAYSKFPDLEPKPMSDLEQRALDSVVKNPRRDATILFDVKLERFK
jgi:FKBP-type peptidyl-prolyl cis-trans isomerase